MLFLNQKLWSLRGLDLDETESVKNLWHPNVSFIRPFRPSTFPVEYQHFGRGQLLYFDFKQAAVFGLEHRI